MGSVVPKLSPNGRAEIAANRKAIGASEPRHLWPGGFAPRGVKRLANRALLGTALGSAWLSLSGVAVKAENRRAPLSCGTDEDRA
jgi:hypothetical protein